MELNAEQIKKALEICGNEELDTCKGCPYAEDTNCNELIAKDALSLIKSQEQRIKELEAELATRPPKLIITKKESKRK